MITTDASSDFPWPDPALVVRETSIDRPAFPVIDAHNHLSDEFGAGWFRRDPRELEEKMDEVGVSTFIDLDGAWGEAVLLHRLDKFKTAMGDRYEVCTGVDWSQWGEKRSGFGEWTAGRLVQDVSRGATGIKIWKPFGLEVTDHTGTLAPIDTEQLDPLWDTAARLGVPVVIHTADPVAFFDPIDERNERTDELAEFPEWSFSDERFPSFGELMAQLERLVARHPATTFVGAHVGCYAENLGWVGRMLDQYPNFNVDIAARLGELGRQPYTAHRFFTEHSDRILFGLDYPGFPDLYRVYYRFLETDDEYFDYGIGERPEQGRWRIYGINLPTDALEKIYRTNAARIFRLPSD